MFTSIVGSARLAPYIILLTILGFPIPLFLKSKIVTWIIFILFPLPCFLAIQANSAATNIGDINIGINMTFIEGHIILIFSSIFYISLSIFLDYRKFTSTIIKPHPNALRRKYDIIEPLGIEEEKENTKSASEEFLIQCCGIEKTFENNVNSLYAIQNLNLTLRKQEVLGVIGPNGAGKTTLFNLIGSFHHRNRGDIFLDGKKLESNSQNFFNNTGLCLQEDIFWDDLSVRTHLKYICMMKGIDYSVINIWLEAVGLIKFSSYLA